MTRDNCMKLLSLIILSMSLFSCVSFKNDQKILYYKLDIKNVLDTCEVFTYKPQEDFIITDTSRFIFFDIDYDKHKIVKQYYFNQLSDKEEIVKRIANNCTSYLTTKNYKFARIKVYYRIKRGHKKEIEKIYYIDKAKFIWRSS